MNPIVTVFKREGFFTTSVLLPLFHPAIVGISYDRPTNRSRLIRTICLTVCLSTYSIYVCLCTHLCTW